MEMPNYFDFANVSGSGLKPQATRRNTMKKSLLLISVLALGLVGSVLADDIKIPNDVSGDLVRIDCPTDGYVYYGVEVGATLETDVWHVYGPIQIAGGDPFLDIMMDVALTQTWVGDLVAQIYYDVDCDGVYDFGPVDALCRPNLEGPCDNEGCCGCSSDVDGTYMFGDAGAPALGEADGCVNPILPGCFMPAIESATFAATFAGVEAGGCFYIEIVDSAAGDDTFLSSVGVWVAGGTSASDLDTWGSIKGDFK
jgi:hypothetical protein